MTNEQFLHDLVAELLGLPLNRVINAYSNAPRPSETHAVVKYYGHKQEVPSERRIRDSDGNADLIARWIVWLDIQLFVIKGEENALVRLKNLINKLDLFNVQERCKQQNIALITYEPVKDLSSLIDGRIWESRAMVEIQVRFTDVLNDVLPMIERVQITGKTGELPVDTGIIDKNKEK